MKSSLKYKFIACIVTTILTIWMLTPTVWSIMHPNEDKLPKWMPKTAMKLGLDLKGGVHMVLGVDLNKVVLDQLASTGHSLEKALEKENIKAITKVLPDQFELEFNSPSSEEAKKVAAFIPNHGNLEVVGADGPNVVARFTRLMEDDLRSRAIEQSIETIRNRIDEFGVAEPIISRKGDNQILVQFPGEQEPERLKGLIGQTAQLTFQIVHECIRKRSDGGGECLMKQRAFLNEKIKEAETKGSYNKETYKKFSEYRARLNQDLKAQLPPDTMIAFEKERNVNVSNESVLIPYLLSTKNILSGEYIQNAYVNMQKENNLGADRPVVAFEMNPVGGPLLGQLTTEFQDHYMAIVLDGVVRSAPSINSPITGGSGIITLGAGTMEEAGREARDLSIVLRAGALPASIETQEERVIGPSMGQDAIDAGVKALALSSILIFMFMWLYYGTSGFIANIVNFISVALIFALLGSVGSTLTLPGIAGVILTLGMAVDAMIIIFERMREEIRAKRSSRQVIEMGFDKAFSTILDSNITTAIGGFVLLQYGTGSIRGFALTLLVGIIVNVFMATFFAKTLFEVFSFGKEKLIGIGLSRRELQALEA